jgi:hypothetical protein
MERTMERVKKDHYSAFCKHLQVCDPLSGCKFFEGDTSSLWYELRARDVDRKALDDHPLLCLDRAKDVMAQDLELIC